MNAHPLDNAIAFVNKQRRGDLSNMEFWQRLHGTLLKARTLHEWRDMTCAPVGCDIIVLGRKEAGQRRAQEYRCRWDDNIRAYVSGGGHLIMGDRWKPTQD